MSLYPGTIFDESLVGKSPKTR